MKKTLNILIALLTILTATSAFASGGSDNDVPDEIFAETAAPPAQDPGIGTLIEMQNSFRSVAQKVLPVVVEVDVIDVVTRTSNRSNSPFNFFGSVAGTEAALRSSGEVVLDPG